MRRRRGDQESAGSQLDQGCKDRREIEFGARVHDMESAARGRGPQLEILYASTEADIDTLVNIDQVYRTAGDDESVCRQHGQRLLWYVIVVFLRRTLVSVILIRMESNEV